MKVAFHTLGCKVNTYETNVIEDLFKNRGYEVVSDNADIFFVNTCTVTNSSDRKSRQLINRLRRENPTSVIIAMGCMVQVNSEQLDKENIDIMMGTTNRMKVVDYLEEYLENRVKHEYIEKLENTLFEDMTVLCFKKQTRAFVKIQDGCDNFCSYCIIPYSRGRVRSKKRENVISEIKSLVKSGYKEIVLTGIHTGQYGKDLDDYSFSDLLEEIIKIDGLERLRISSIEINEITDKVIELMKDNNIFARHLHIPLQSGNDIVLSDMNRKYDIKYFEERINMIRALLPNISITTDIIVGFPTETEKLFSNTISFLERISFSKIHVFPFSLRKGTEAEKYINIVKDIDKTNRVKKVIEVSKACELKYMHSFVGKNVSVLFEHKKSDYYLGHSSNYLNIKCYNDIELNKLIDVKVVKIEYPFCIVE